MEMDSDDHGLELRLTAIENAIRSLGEETERRAVAMSQKLDALIHALPSAVVDDGDYVATVVDGHIVAVPHEERDVAIYHALRGTLEPGLVAAFRRVLRPGMTVVDIGANLGVFTLHALDGIANQGRVIAFEPIPRTYDALRRNLKLNGFADSEVVVTHAQAVSDRNGVARMFYEIGNAGHSTLYRKPNAAASEVTVEMVRLDDAVPDHSVDVIKIDVEGAEPAVLAGMPEIVRANPHLVIFLEFAPVHLARAGTEPVEFAAALRERFGTMVVDDASGQPLTMDLAELARRPSTNLILTAR
jgi:FkbM family methyltransferase